MHVGVSLPLFCCIQHHCFCSPHLRQHPEGLGIFLVLLLLPGILSLQPFQEHCLKPQPVTKVLGRTRNSIWSSFLQGELDINQLALWALRCPPFNHMTALPLGLLCGSHTHRCPLSGLYQHWWGWWFPLLWWIQFCLFLSLSMKAEKSSLSTSADKLSLVHRKGQKTFERNTPTKIR